MPVNTEAVYKAAVMLAEVEEMQVTVSNTFAASAITALAGTGGFLLLGPAGLVVGSTVAGLGAYCRTKNKFKPVYAILTEDLRPQQQQELIDLVKKAFADVDISDFLKLSVLMSSNQAIWEHMRELIIVYVTQYFMKELAVKNVKVEVKPMTDLERYQKFTEQFKKQNGLTGPFRPAVAGAADSEAVSGSQLAAAPGWQPVVAASTADTSLRTDATADATAPTWPPAAAAEASAHTNQPNIPAHAGIWDGRHPSEEEAPLPSVPKTALKNTF